ncbi:MAG: host attachment protein [Alphaproteobacteria bacterium]
MSWVVVADGGRARLFAMEKGPASLYQMPDSEFEGPHRRNRDIMADKPGRSFDSSGQHRHALEPHSDPARNDERHFLKTVVDRIDAAHKHGEFSGLVVVAPPRVLGEIRAMLPHALSKIVTHEVGRDLAHATIGDIRDHLVKAMTLSSDQR